MVVKETKRVPRVLIAKVGLDGHSRGALVVAQGLRQAGMEVIYTGLRQTPSSVAAAAVQEDVDVIGVSSMVGAHVSAARKLVNELRRLNADIPIIMGGIVPEEDYDTLAEIGVKKVFPPGTMVEEIAQYIYSLVEGPQWVPEVPGSLTGSLRDGLHLLGSKCTVCGRVFFPSRRNCPRCLLESVKQIQLSDRGTLETFTVATVAPLGYEVPHVQGYVFLDGGGPRVFSLLTDHEDGAKLGIGSKMVLKIVKVGEDQSGSHIIGYRFRPMDED